MNTVLFNLMHQLSPLKTFTRALGLSKYSKWAKPVNRTLTRAFSAESSSVRNARLRLELATAYRTFDRQGMNDGIYNHLTAMAPAADGSGKEVMLLIPFGTNWSEVTPSCLLGLDSDNNIVEGRGKADITATCLHQGLHQGHPHREVVMHLHPPYLTALNCLKDPTFLMLHQNSVIYANSIAYDRHFGGFASSSEEAQRLSKILGDKSILFMGNHGVTVISSTVSVALELTCILERCAMFQILAISTGKELAIIPDNVVQKAQEFVDDTMQDYADASMEACIRLCQKECDEFKQ